MVACVMMIQGSWLLLHPTRSWKGGVTWGCITIATLAMCVRTWEPEYKEFILEYEEGGDANAVGYHGEEVVSLPPHPLLHCCCPQGQSYSPSFASLSLFFFCQPSHLVPLLLVHLVHQHLCETWSSPRKRPLGPNGDSKFKLSTISEYNS